MAQNRSDQTKSSLQICDQIEPCQRNKRIRQRFVALTTAACREYGTVIAKTEKSLLVNVIKIINYQSRLTNNNEFFTRNFMLNSRITERHAVLENYLKL